MLLFSSFCRVKDAARFPLLVATTSIFSLGVLSSLPPPWPAVEQHMSPVPPSSLFSSKISSRALLIIKNSPLITIEKSKTGKENDQSQENNKDYRCDHATLLLKTFGSFHITHRTNPTLFRRHTKLSKALPGFKALLCIRQLCALEQVPALFVPHSLLK